MKFKADRATLLKALAHVQSVVEKRNTIPILANVLIAVQDGRLTLTATDMEIAIVEDVAGQHQPRRRHAPRRPRRCTRSSASCRTAPRSSWTTPAATPQLALRAGRYATSLVVLPTEDFPSMTAGALPHRFSCRRQTLRGLIDRTRFAIRTEETRYYLNGIYLHAAESDGGQGAARGRDRRPPPGAGRGAAAGGRGRHAGRDRAAQDGRPSCASCWTR